MYIVAVRFSSVVSGKECPKSSVRLVSDNARVRSITKPDAQPGLTSGSTLGRAV